jgi:hypothetical protein
MTSMRVHTYSFECEKCIAPQSNGSPFLAKLSSLLESDAWNANLFQGCCKPKACKELFM